LETSSAADDLIAGKPAPTGYLLSADCVYDINHCGSWLASDGVSEGNKKARRRMIICGLFHNWA
jgi:hypothetical protein